MRIQFTNTYLYETIEVGVVRRNSYLRAIKARLIVCSIFKLYKYVWIFIKSRVLIAIVILWLRGRAVNVLDNLPP